MDEIVLQFIEKNNVHSIGKENIRLHLQSHHDYPSFKSITDTFDYFGIDNVAAAIPLKAFDQLPDVFLSLVKKESGHELVLVEKEKKSISLMTSNTKKSSVTKDTFLKIWQGNVIVIDKQPKQTIFENMSFLSAESLLYLNLILGLIFICYINGSNLFKNSYLLLGALGITLSIFAVRKSIGIKDAVTDHICNAVQPNKQGCEKVININQYKFLGLIGFGEAALGYFSCMFLITLTHGLTSSMGLFTVASIIAVGYAIYLQGLVVKQWCGLCLMIAAVIILQNLIWFSVSPGWNFNPTSGLALLLYFLIITTAVFRLKLLLTDSLELHTVKTKLYSFKQDTRIFFDALHQSEQLATQLKEEHQLRFGNMANPSIKLTAVTNPLCGYCSKPFQSYKKLLQRNVQLQVIFNVSPDTNNKATKIATTIASLYQSNKPLALQALFDWFETKDVKRWLAKYELNNQDQTSASEILNSHLNWVKQNGINYTPETLINGYKFPKRHYELEDLGLFVSEFKEKHNGTALVAV